MVVYSKITDVYNLVLILQITFYTLYTWKGISKLSGTITSENVVVFHSEWRLFSYQMTVEIDIYSIVFFQLYA